MNGTARRNSRRTSPIGVTIARKYGTAEIIGFAGARRIEIYRPSEVHPSEPWNREITENPMCLDHYDATPSVSTYGYQCGDRDAGARAYDSRCSCCYLNINHTAALHDTRIAATDAATAGKAAS